MKVIYDPQTDSPTIILRDVPVKESDEITDDLIVDYVDGARIVAIEMLDASENVWDCGSCNADRCMKVINH